MSQHDEYIILNERNLWLTESMFPYKYVLNIIPRPEHVMYDDGLLKYSMATISVMVHVNRETFLCSCDLNVPNILPLV